MTSSGGLEEVALDPESHQVVDASQGHASVYLSSTHGHFPPPMTMGSKALSWDLMPRTDNGSSENGSNSAYHRDQQKELISLRGFQDGSNATPSASTSSNLGSANGPHDYAAGYTPYPNSTDPYGYGNTSYPNYYYGYQQQATHPYSQQGGAYQNSGAPYQPLNSFHNTGSYVGPTTSSTYYNAGDYQNTGGYQTSGYGSHTNTWNDGNYGNYPQHHQYSNYTSSDTNGSQSSSTVAANSLHYQQQYKQWADYYNQTASDVCCAPGTENTSVSTASSLECPIPGVSDAFAISNSQPPPPGTSSSWRPASSSSEVPSFQASTAIADAGWKLGAPGFPNHSQSQMSSYFQKPFDSILHYDNTEDQQKSVCPQGPDLQFPATHQVSQSFHPPLQTVSALDTTRRVSKLQIPTNPRITSTLAMGLPKPEKDSPVADAASKPAYISVTMPKSNNKLTSHDAADAMLKPGMFPTSLRAYVERALSRCKDDSHKAACQEIMKEMITKASLDGTLFTRDWDTEPLFPLPTTMGNAVNDNLQSPVMFSSLPKFKKSPSRRTKSRWEPIAEDKLIEKLASVNHMSVKDGTQDHLKERGNVASAGKCDSKDDAWGNIKFFSSQPQIVTNKNVQRPTKKQRFGDHLNNVENGDTSSDSDKELGLTAYYSGAVALTNSPEERKRRENRSKRFEKRNEHRAETKQFRPKVSGTGHSVTRRVNALLLAKNHEDGSSRAVEDIDWDALTVRGTCQEIEKRYLRLTSAPDPSTVRPEEVLEKALSMVQSSEKNYFYKCDQLKSIRQDLTVQRIRNELTVKVYETHARLALEAGDLPEYNQCQSQLTGLYAEGIKGCHLEFAAYNLLCVIMHSNNNRDLVSSMARLSMEAKRDDAVKHALAVRAAVTSGNYILFFRLYRTAPNLNTCLMDLYVEKMRFEAVRCISRAYRPTVPIGFIAQVLGFAGVAPVEGNDEKDSDRLEECQEWLKAHGASFTVDSYGELQLDTKVTASSLYMPDPDDAVAHGDSTLAVNDFLTRTL